MSFGYGSTLKLLIELVAKRLGRAFMAKRHETWSAFRRRQLEEGIEPQIMENLGYLPVLRTDVLNLLIYVRKYQTYLEIGVHDPKLNYNRIEAAQKDGVDPAGNCNYPVTSDAFFAANSRTYDLIFIDGLHLADQVSRDIENALNVLNENGMILLHDCNPQTEIAQRETWNGMEAWNGSVWKAFALCRMTRPDLFMCTVAVDCGIGVIVPGRQKLFPSTDKTNMDYAFLVRHRRELLNLVSFYQFRNIVDNLKRNMIGQSAR
jgi:hypothetical protein